MAIPAPSQPVYRKRHKQGDYVVMAPADQLEVGEVTVHLRSGATQVETVKGVGAIFYVGETACRYGYLTENTSRTAITPAPAKSTAQSDIEPATAMPSEPVTLDAADFAPDDGTGGEYFEADEAA